MSVEDEKRRLRAIAEHHCGESLMLARALSRAGISKNFFKKSGGSTLPPDPPRGARTSSPLDVTGPGDTKRAKMDWETLIEDIAKAVAITIATTIINELKNLTKGGNHASAQNTETGIETPFQANGVKDA